MHEQWEALPPAEKGKYTQIALKKNQAIALEKAQVKEKLRNYTKTGPLGSVEKHCVVDTEEISALLQKEDSVLVELWKEKNILPWSREFDKKNPPFTHSCGAEAIYDRTILPGTMCRRCATRRSNFLAESAKMRYSIKSAFKEFNGRGEGLSVCVITERMNPEKPNWFGYFGGPRRKISR